MMQLPFDQNDLSPLELYLLSKIAVMDDFITQLATTLVKAQPALQQAVVEMSSKASIATERLTEIGAASYLQTHGDEFTPSNPNVGRDKLLLLNEALEASVKSSAAVTVLLQPYLANTEVTTAYSTMHFPISMNIGVVLLDGLGIKGCCQPSKNAQAFHAQIKENAAKNQYAYFTDFFNPLMTSELVLLIPLNEKHVLAICPARGRWYIATFTSTRAAYFIHHQARIVDLAVLKATLNELFSSLLPAPMQALLKPQKVICTSIKNVANSIYKNLARLDTGKYPTHSTLECNERHYSFRVDAARVPEGGMRRENTKDGVEKWHAALMITPTYNPFNAKVIMVAKNTDFVFVEVGARMSAANGAHVGVGKYQLSSLTTQSQNILLELLQKYDASLIPAKKAPKRAIRKPRKS